MDNLNSNYQRIHSSSVLLNRLIGSIPVPQRLKMVEKGVNTKKKDKVERFLKRWAESSYEMEVLNLSLGLPPAVRSPFYQPSNDHTAAKKCPRHPKGTHTADKCRDACPLHPKANHSKAECRSDTRTSNSSSNNQRPSVNNHPKSSNNPPTKPPAKPTAEACVFHKTTGHSNEDCYMIKKVISELQPLKDAAGSWAGVKEKALELLKAKGIVPRI